MVSPFSPTRPAILDKTGIAFPWFLLLQQLLFLPALTESNRVTAEARRGHNDLIQRLLIAEHLEDLQEKWGGWALYWPNPLSKHPHAAEGLPPSTSSCPHTTSVEE